MARDICGSEGSFSDRGKCGSRIEAGDRTIRDKNGEKIGAGPVLRVSLVRYCACQSCVSDGAGLGKGHPTWTCCFSHDMDARVYRPQIYVDDGRRGGIDPAAKLNWCSH